VQLKKSVVDDVEDLGTTEVIKNSLDPHWTSSFNFDFEISDACSLKVSIYDKNSKGKSMKDDPYMGGTVFSVGTVLGKRGNSMGKRIRSGGTIYAHIEREEKVGRFLFQLRGIDLKNVEDSLLSKSDPFFEISRQVEGGGEWSVVYRSEHVKKNLSPLWNSTKIDLDRLCGAEANLQNVLKLSVFDHESSGKHLLIGSLETTISELIAAKKFGGGGDAGNGDGFLELFDSKSKCSGTIAVLQARIVGIPMKPVEDIPEVDVPEEIARPTFVDYLSGGCELNLCIALDFTGSNGDPRVPDTLHYLSKDGSLNAYETAITKIGSILADYDTDKQFPVWGFGAKLQGEVRHAFAISNGEVVGINEVLKAYRRVFGTGFIMSSPTDITKVVKVASLRANRLYAEATSNGALSYSVLLLVTDGVVTDINSTIEALVDAKDSPLSILIVGVGQEDFSDMHYLDKEGNITFVAVNECSSQTSYVKKTLAKLPDQLVDYFIEKEMYPPSAINATDEELDVEDVNEEDVIFS